MGRLVSPEAISSDQFEHRGRFLTRVAVRLVLTILLFVASAPTAAAATAFDIAGTWNDSAVLTTCGYACGSPVGRIYTTTMLIVADTATTFHGTYADLFPITGTIVGNLVSFHFENFPTSAGLAQGACEGPLFSSGLQMTLSCIELIQSPTGLQVNGTTTDTVTRSVLPFAEIAMVGVSNPPAYLHIGPPPFSIGPSAAFPTAVTDSFSVLDTVRNDGPGSSAQANVAYYLSQSGGRDYPLSGARSIPPLAPGQTNSDVATASVPMGTPAGKYFVLACVASSCVQSATKTLVIDFNSAVQNSVVPPDIDGGLIAWGELPNFLLSGKQAAELGGFDHLNWKQIVVSDSAPLLGLISLGTDPALGGNLGQRIACTAEALGAPPGSVTFDVATGVLKIAGLVVPRSAFRTGADFFDWYNNEVKLGCQSADEFFVDDVGTNFVDNPNAVIPSRTWVFETYLAGVRGDGSGRVLQEVPGVHVHWQYTQHFFGGTISDVSVGAQRGSGPSFGTSEFLGYINPEDFTPDRIRRLKLSGALAVDASLTVSPTRGSQSETMSLLITGNGTHFSPGLSSVTFSGVGIVLNSFTVTSATTGVANITIASDALPFTRHVYVATGDEVAGATAAFLVTPVIQVSIVPKPDDGASPPINPAAKGKIPVAILSTHFFSAPDSIRPESLKFGRTGTELPVSRCHVQDVNGDGLEDLLCQFDSVPTGFQAGDTTAVLRGLTVAGDPVKGTATIRIAPR